MSDSLSEGGQAHRRVAGLHPDSGSGVRADAHLTVRQVAEYCAVSVRTVWNWIADDLPIIRHSARCVRVDPLDLQRFLDRRRADPRA